MPAQSVAQQRLMGMVHAIQKGKPSASPGLTKLAKGISKKAAKDFASTPHAGLPDRVMEYLLQERSIDSIQSDLSKTFRSIQKQLQQYKLAKSDEEKRKHTSNLKSLGVIRKKLEQELHHAVTQLYKDVELKTDEVTATGNVQGYATPHAFSKGDTSKRDRKQAELVGYALVKENRWVQLKREESPPQAKIGRGIANINKQLAEIENFIRWYGRLKQESGVTNEDFWKRTNRNIFRIKERLVKLEQQMRKISE
jgi:hypothetical protein